MPENQFMGEQEFDINRPKTPRYVHQEYPKVIYKDGGHKIIHSLEAEKSALAEGYTLRPEFNYQTGEPLLQPAEYERTAEDVAEDERVERAISDRKKELAAKAKK